MKTSSTLPTLALLVLLPAAVLAQGMGTSAGHDLDELWARAQENHDLAAEDAVLLLESRTLTHDGTGAVAERVHRVVWIGTSQGIRAHADLRVPWNAADATLEVELLRTWRDGRWWPDPRRISDTAVVETLPHALDHADDYTTMRETMLLHDGVELPCIMETAYTIATQHATLPGSDGMFVLARREPAVRVEYLVRLPAEAEVRHEALHGAPTAFVSEDDGIRQLAWTMEDVPARTLPLTAQPAAHEPTAVWSTWAHWNHLTPVVKEIFTAQAACDSSMAAAVHEAIAGRAGRWARVRAVLDLVDERVRPIRYDHRHWLLAPRPAARTWATGYGHAVDRVVLAMALVGEADRGDERALAPQPLLVEDGFADVAPNLPRLAGYDGLLLDLGSINGARCAWDPATGALGTETARLGRKVRPDYPGFAFSGGVEVDVGLEPDDEDGWRGTARLVFAGAGNPWADVQATEDGGREVYGRALAAVLPGAEIDWLTPERVEGRLSELRVGFTLAELPRGGADRPRLVLGDPDHGVHDLLPEDVRLHDTERGSPVFLPHVLQHTVRLRVKADAGDFAHLPDPMSVKNVAGEFRVVREQDGDWLTLERRLTVRPVREVNAGVVPPDQWPLLRELLLEDLDAAHRTLVWEGEG